jgi:hypothetical protein
MFQNAQSELISLVEKTKVTNISCNQRFYLLILVGIEREQTFGGMTGDASRKTIGEHDGVGSAGARSGDALELEGFFFKQAVEHTPGESAVAAATLER